MGKAEDCGDYYRIPADTRDLNYEAFFSEGSPRDLAEGRLPFAQHAAAGRRRNGRDAAAALHYVKTELEGWRP